jgi:hypothetical protein
MPRQRAGEWMTGSRALGLPSGITRNLANTTTPIPVNRNRGYAAANRRVPYTNQSNHKPTQTRDLTGPTPSWMT